MNIGILGCGAYALALASILDKNNHKITMWTKLEDEYNNLITNRKNPKLKEYDIPEKINITTNISEACLNKDLIIFAVPAEFIDKVAKEANKFITDQHICIATKGIENDTCRFVDDVVLRRIKTNRISVISGPSFAVDIIKEAPIGLSLATKNKKTRNIVIEALANRYVKLRATKDIKGIEICGSIKNVIAIAAGMLDGMGMPESTKAMLITESLHDIKQLIHHLGGDKKTILSYAGFGDLLLTCTSTKSRNFSYGRMIGQKKSNDEIDNYVNSTTIEGLYTLKSIYKLLNNKHVDMPIVDHIYDIIMKNEPVENLNSFLIDKV